MKDAYTTKELLPVMGITKVTLLSRAKREGWASRPRRGRGGGNEWLVSGLPEDVRLKLMRAAETDRPAVSVQTLATAPVSDTKRTKALARADVVALYADWLCRAEHGSKGAARESFISAYRGGAWPRLLEELGPKVSWKTIERWKVNLRRTSTVVSLVDQRGRGNASRAVMTEHHVETLLRAVLHPNSPAVSECLRNAGDAMRAMGLDVPSEATMRRFLTRWRETNFGSWVYTREGKKAWNDKCAFFIERDYDKINVGDILVADGHVLNFETLNPETGKPQRMELVMWYDMKSNCPLGWEIMPTENTQAIASAFRRAVIALGKYPIIAYLDNGRAFRSKYFNGVDFAQTGIGGLFQEMGVNTIFAWPYHGQSKTVERFFGTMHDLERWVPSYTGINIETKPPRLKRGEELHRKAWSAAGGRALTLEETHIAVAKWIDKYINIPQRGHLNGKCPAEVFLAGRGPGVDELKLRHLMLAKDVRKVGREGIRLLGHRYYAEELSSMICGVQVRYDLDNLDSILVYSQGGGRLICEARRVDKVHPAADLLGNVQDQQELREQLALKQSQEKHDTNYVRGVLEDCLTDNRQRMSVLNTTKQNDTPKAAPKLSADKVASIETARQLARAAREAAPAYTPPAEINNITTELEKYEYLFDITYRKGIALREADREWMEYYENTEEYAVVAAPRYDKLRQRYVTKTKAN